MNKLTISVVVDSPKSWMNEYIHKFVDDLKNKGNNVKFCQKHDEILNGDIAIFLSCIKLVKPELLKRNKHNLVVHQSDLPKGKGWSPVTWQILKGKSKIWFTLFEAVKAVDAGPIYSKDFIDLKGHELIVEVRKMQAEKNFDMVFKFLEKYPNVESKPQEGEESFYPKRTPKDSELDINKTIKEQFNLLRVVDNERYPAFFTYMGHKFILKIEKESE